MRDQCVHSFDRVEPKRSHRKEKQARKPRLRCGSRGLSNKDRPISGGLALPSVPPWQPDPSIKRSRVTFLFLPCCPKTPLSWSNVKREREREGGEGGRERDREDVARLASFHDDTQPLVSLSNAATRARFRFFLRWSARTVVLSFFVQY